MSASMFTSRILLIRGFVLYPKDIERGIQVIPVECHGRLRQYNTAFNPLAG